MASPALSPHRTLAALADCILEGAPIAPESRDAFLAPCGARLASLPPHRRDRLALAVRTLGARATVLLAIGRAAPFHRLDAADRARCFAAFGRSALPPIRSAHEAVRRLVLAVHYAHPAVAAAIGYRGPMHLRAPVLAWEGPATGAMRDDEPVARGIALPLAPAPRVRPIGVVDVDTVTGDVHRSADAVVIGTGAGGAVAAATLAEAGFETVMLEAGEYHVPSDFDERDAELTERLYADGAMRATDDLAVSLLQGRAVGGSTVVNWMIMLRTPDWVLEEWAREHGAYGMSAGEMAPVFDSIEAATGTRTVPDDAHSANNRIILDGARALGWRARAGAINARGCVRCGFCGTGCRHDAKQSALVTWVPRALAAGATLYPRADVVRIEQRERDLGTRATTRGTTPPRKRVHARMRGADGALRGLTIDAPLVVLAAGAVGTPVLLQRSGMGGGGVGEWLRLHPTTAVLGAYDHVVDASSGIPLSTICDEFVRWNGTDHGFWLECPPMHPSFAAAAMPGFGAEHAARMTSMQRLGALIALTRDGADRRRSSGAVRVDRLGNVSITYALAPPDADRVRASMVAAARLHLAAGARSVTTLHGAPVVARSEHDLDAIARAPVAPNRLGLFSAHVNGTCRIGTRPSHSGATPDGERHGVRGLYITDGSLLPTAPGVNPQETIMAVSSVLAQRVCARHGGITRQ